MAKQKPTFDPKRPKGDEVKVQAGHAATITDITIKSAFIFGNRRAQRKIEDHGRLNRQILRELGARIVAR